MEKQYIEKIISRIFFLSDQLIAQLLKERKTTGDYRKEVVIQEEGLDYLFVVLKHKDKYPATKKNLRFSVVVRETGKTDNILTCGIEPEGYYSSYAYKNVNRNGELVMRNPLHCDKSHIKSLVRTGDSICLQKGGLANGSDKVAFAKVEVLSEYFGGDKIYRKVALTKELGHPETYAYVVYPNKVATYIGDEQTLEYFGDKEMINGVLGFSLVKNYTTYNDVGWYWFEKEEIDNRLIAATIELGMPRTVEEVTLEVKESALKKLLENCEGEFAYGDQRVKAYADDYAIL